MPTMDEYLAMMQPDPEANRKARIFQALGGLGAGLLGGGGWQRGLARGGLLAHDAMNDASNRASSDQMAQFKMRAAAQEMADKDSAREGEAKFQQQLSGVFSNAPRLNNMGTGGPTHANAAAVAPPDRVEKLRQAAEMYAARGQVKEAQMLMAEAEKMEGTFSVDPKVGLGPDGKPQFGQFSNKGLPPRIAQGFTPPPDLQAVNRGNKIQFEDKLTMAPGTSFDVGMSPDAKARNAVDWANINDRRAREKAESMGGAAGGTAGVAGAGKPTDQQLAAQSFLERMQNASSNINKLEAEGYAPGIPSALVEGTGKIPLVGGIVRGIGTALGNQMMPQSQLYRQAQEEWVRAKLRKESGAVIGESEMEGEIRTYFPQPSDSQELIQQKARARAVAERSISGQASGQRQGAMPQQQGGRSATGNIKQMSNDDLLRSLGY